MIPAASFPPYWRETLDDLQDAYDRVCAEFAEARWSGDITDAYLARHSPFVARELHRQGRVDG